MAAKKGLEAAPGRSAPRHQGSDVRSRTQRGCAFTAGSPRKVLRAGTLTTRLTPGTWPAQMRQFPAPPRCRSFQLRPGAHAAVLPGAHQGAVDQQLRQPRPGCISTQPGPPHGLISAFATTGQRAASPGAADGGQRRLSLRSARARRWRAQANLSRHVAFVGRLDAATQPAPRRLGAVVPSARRATRWRSVSVLRRWRRGGCRSRSCPRPAGQPRLVRSGHNGLILTDTPIELVNPTGAARAAAARRRWNQPRQSRWVRLRPVRAPAVVGLLDRMAG